MTEAQGGREAGPTLSPGQLAQALRERTPKRYFMMERYGPDGEILEAWESFPIEADHQGVTAVAITGVGYAEPRRDWRERGIVPPRGFHRRAEIEQRRDG